MQDGSIPPALYTYLLSENGKDWYVIDCHSPKPWKPVAFAPDMDTAFFVAEGLNERHRKLQAAVRDKAQSERFQKERNEFLDGLVRASRIARGLPVKDIDNA